MATLSAEHVIELLGLKPLPGEGGFYAETYRPGFTIAADRIDARYDGERGAATAIYYLVTPDSFSALHRLTGDEVYHFYAGDPIDLALLYPDGSHQTARLGNDLVSGQRPQIVVPGGCWQGSALEPGGSWGLVGTTMTPGFDLRDFELGDRGRLIAEYPSAVGLIKRLTRT
ncbi:cupin domain-containing protein [soil metagenome]